MPEKAHYPGDKKIGKCHTQKDGSDDRLRDFSIIELVCRGIGARSN